MVKPIIHVDNVRVTYNAGKSNAYEALKGESADIYPGEYIILFGPSGCGKSTLLYSILGTLPPTSGLISIKGDDIYKYTTMQMSHFQRSTIGIIYQSFNLIPSISVLDNVALPQIFAGIAPAARERRGMLLLKRFGVDQQAHKLPNELSGGQMQRIAVARSLVNNPEILLADEPVGNLDIVSSDQVMNTLEEVNLQDKKTVILVTHDAKLLPYAHRVYRLTFGQVVGEVINPDKVQIRQTMPGTSVSTEIEKLARLYPYDTSEELRVKSFVNFLTQDLTFDQIGRIEKFVGEYIKGRMADDNFVESLSRSYEEGGVGLDIDRAKRMDSEIARILSEAMEIRQYREYFKDKRTSAKQENRVVDVRRALLNECGITLTSERQEDLDFLIKARIRGFITAEDFRKRIGLGKEAGGISLTYDQSQKVSRYMEKMLAQGLYI